MKVLVVDDSKLSQIVIHKFLKELYADKLDVKFAFTGEEGLEIFESDFKPEICTVDIVMSGIDGIETSKRMAKINPKIKIIIITSTNEVLENFKDNSCIKTLVIKPITSEKITKAFKIVDPKF
jgi:two-component system chemotaxis response regulator CheY